MLTEKKMINRQLRKNLFECYKGWFLWHKITHSSKVDYQTAVILMPREEEYCMYAMLYVDEYIAVSGYSKAVFLTTEDRYGKLVSSFSKNSKVMVITDKQRSRLILLYCLYNFDSRFVLASLNEPAGRRGETLIGVHGLTAEEAFAVGIYKLNPFRKKHFSKVRAEDKS